MNRNVEWFKREKVIPTDERGRLNVEWRGEGFVDTCVIDRFAKEEYWCRCKCYGLCANNINIDMCNIKKHLNRTTKILLEMYNCNFNTNLKVKALLRLLL